MNVTPPTHTSVCFSHSASDVCVCAFLPVFTHAKLELLQAGRFKIKKKGKQHRVHNAASQCSCSGLLKLQDWRPELAKKKQLTAKRDTLQQRNSSLSPLFRLHISISGSVEGGGRRDGGGTGKRSRGGVCGERERERRGNLQEVQNWIFPAPLLKVLNWTFPPLSLFQLVESAGWWRGGLLHQALGNWIFSSAQTLIESHEENYISQTERCSCLLRDKCDCVCVCTHLCVSLNIFYNQRTCERVLSLIFFVLLNSILGFCLKNNLKTGPLGVSI